VVQSFPHDRTGGANRLGPNLHSVIGHKASAVDSFSYSKPVQETDVTRTKEPLDKHPADPRSFILSRDGFSGPQERRGSLEYHRLPEEELLSHTTHTSAPSVRC
jgi:cytochrome c2